MDIETETRYSNKRGGYQRPGPSSAAQSNRVCFHWRAGRCNRHPCPFLHSELPPVDGPAATPPKRAHHQVAASVGDERGFHPKGLVWRNPNTANPGPPSKWGKGRGAGGPGPAAAAGKVADRVCRYFLAGKCSYGDGCRFLHSWFVGDNFSLLTPLQGHQKVITGIALPMGSDKLYSGSKDETLRAWNCQTGQCEGVLNLGGEVGCMISEGPWIFVGIPHFVKGWNTQLNTDVSLPGPSGQVYALVVGNNLLFAGVQDGQILSWKFSAAMNSFEPVTSLSGHRLAVVTMVVGANRLYSGSMDHTIKVWDLTSLQCIQTLNDHTNVIMSLLCWDQFLLSCSLDQTIKVWVATESGNLEVTYTHNEEHGVLTLCGMPDAQGKPVLFCSCNDNSICLYDLPSFGERGKIFSKEEVRAIKVGPDGLFFTGDGTGELKVWKWLNETPAA